jgi:hypothetical protein
MLQRTHVRSFKPLKLGEPLRASRKSLTDVMRLGACPNCSWRLQEMVQCRCAGENFGEAYRSCAVTSKQDTESWSNHHLRCFLAMLRQSQVVLLSCVSPTFDNVEPDNFLCFHVNKVVVMDLPCLTSLPRVVLWIPDSICSLFYIFHHCTHRKSHLQ